jgi:hypothetical protein
MPLEGMVEASPNQLQYHSQDADAQLFPCSASTAIPGRHPARESTPSRRGRPCTRRLIMYLPLRAHPLSAQSWSNSCGSACSSEK